MIFFCFFSMLFVGCSFAFQRLVYISTLYRIFRTEATYVLQTLKLQKCFFQGAAYVASWLFRARDLSFVFGQKRGENLLDGGAPFYNTYETKDGK